MHYQIIIYHIFRLCNILIFELLKIYHNYFVQQKRKRGEMILPEYSKKKSYAVSIP